MNLGTSKKTELAVKHFCRRLGIASTKNPFEPGTECWAEFKIGRKAAQGANRCILKTQQKKNG